MPCPVEGQGACSPALLHMAAEAACSVTRFALGSVVSSSLNPRYTFTSFVVGRTNEAAYAAASAAAVAPGRVHNPVLLTGATGLGKTHLAHAVAHEAAMRPGRSWALLTADEFLRRLAQGVASGDPTAALASLRAATLLIIDDVHVLDRHATAQDALADLAGDAAAAERQLLLTSDDAEGSAALATRLVGRFRGAHVATLG